MKRIKSKSDLPDWFKLKNYDYLSSLSEKDVLKEFDIRKSPHKYVANPDENEFDSMIWYLITDGKPNWWKYENVRDAYLDEFDDEEDEVASEEEDEESYDEEFSNDLPTDKDELISGLIYGQYDIRKITDPDILEAVYKARKERVKHHNMATYLSNCDELKPIRELYKISKLDSTPSIKPITILEAMADAESISNAHDIHQDPKNGMLNVTKFLTLGAITLSQFKKHKVDNTVPYLMSCNLNLTEYTDIEILNELKRILPVWRKQAAVSSPVKDFNKPAHVKKILQYRIIPLMDLLKWEREVSMQIEAKVLAVTLYPDGEYGNLEYAQTIKPFYKKIMAESYVLENDN